MYLPYETSCTSPREGHEICRGRLCTFHMKHHAHFPCEGRVIANMSLRHPAYNLEFLMNTIHYIIKYIFYTSNYLS